MKKSYPSSRWSGARSQNGRGFFHRQRKVMKKRDYALAPARNPYRVKHPISILFRLKLSAALLFLLGLVSLFIFHPFFQINNYTVSGQQRLTESELLDAIKSSLNFKKFFLLPGQSYLMVNTGEVQAILQERFALESVSVKKTFPDNLSVSVEEKISTVIYDNGAQYSYLGLDGNIIELVQNVTNDEWFEKRETVEEILADGTKRTEEKLIERRHTPALERIKNELGSYPVIYDSRHKEVAVTSAVLNKDTVRGVIDWFNLVERQSDIPFGYIELDSEVGEGVLKTREGWQILIQLSDVQRQFDELQFLLSEKIDRSSLSYIDLRYPGRVYWQ